MKVTIEQLAWYIERDGWRYLRTDEFGSSVYGGTYGSVALPARMVPELDAARDRVYSIMAGRRHAAALKAGR